MIVSRSPCLFARGGDCRLTVQPAREGRLHGQKGLEQPRKPGSIGRLPCVERRSDRPENAQTGSPGRKRTRDGRAPIRLAIARAKVGEIVALRAALPALDSALRLAAQEDD